MRPPLTSNKGIPAGTGMCHRLLKDAIGVENDSIRPWTTTCVGLVCPKNGELLIRAGTRKAEAFIVGEGMRVVVAANCLAVTIVAATLVDRIINIGLPVADAAVSVDAGLTLCTSKERFIRLE